MTGVGSQELRRISTEAPKGEGFPAYYYTTDYFDPSGGAETEADRYRQIRIYPSINTQNVTIHIDYVKEVTALDDDADEPLMPVSDRIVLFYGTLAQAWSSLRRNPEEAARNQGLYQRKLATMAGRTEDSFDTPTLAPKSRYLARMRSQRIGRGFRNPQGGGESSIGNITYLEDVTINGGNVSGNLTVSSGITVDGRDISADGVIIDTISGLVENIETANRVVITDASADLEESAITSTELTYLDEVEPLSTFTMADNQSSAATIASWVGATYQVIQISYSLLRGTAIESGLINVVFDGSSTVSLAQGAVASVGTMGVTFSVAYSATLISLKYTSTSTGTAPSMKYKVQKWAA